MAAVLACGPGALLSHRSGASLWGLIQSDRSAIDVTVIGCRRQRRPRITLHRARKLHPDDRAEVDWIPVTSLARTLLDLAALLPFRRFERAIEEAERLRLFDLRAVAALVERTRGHRGRRALIAAVGAYRPGRLTRSELERLFLDLCRDAGLPTPSTNIFVAEYEVDVVWLEQKLVVELDSREFHLTRAAFERDRIRDATLQLAGYRVLRITHTRLRNEPEAIVDTVRGLLATPTR
jgi:very-short-patch-repair endonuclease